MDIRSFVELKTSCHPDKIYLYFEDQMFTYRQFNERINQSANAFLKLGITKGDRVCLMLPNVPDFLWSWLGLNKIGAVMIPTNTAFKTPEAQYIAEHSEARGIVAARETMDVAESLKARSKSLEWVASVEKKRENGVIDLLALCHNSLVSLETIPLGEEDIASIIYTSGTTGPPKGVMHSHGSYVLCGEAMTVRSDLSSVDKLMVILPLFHANAQFYSTMGSLAAGASMILIRRFSASLFWEQAQRYGATQFSFIGAIGRILISRPHEEFVPGHHIRVANGGYIPEDVYHAFSERFGIPKVIDGYGLTECPGVCQNPIHGRKKIGSMGIPAMHPDPRILLTEMRVVDNQDRELPSGEVGELLARSPLLMKGYFKEPEQTSEALRGGWFHTGDFVYRDADGYYFFVDRKKDIIRRRGENISSVEVEMVINSHPEVAESAVVAAPSSMSEDEVKAFIVLKREAQTTPEEIVDWCLERLADFKVPRYLEFREELPKTPSQRVAKYLLRQGRSEGGKGMMEYVRKAISKKTN